MPKICAICRQGDMLCGACNRLLEEGKINKMDVDVARALHRLGLDAEFLRTVDYENRLIIIAGKDAGRIIGKGGKNAAALTKLLGRELDVIEQGNEKKMVEKLLRVPTLGINKIYGQKETYKIRVEKRFRQRVQTSASLMSKVLDKNVEIIFE